MRKKHLLMIKTFIKVMLGMKEEIKYIIPDSYVENVFKINYKNLKEKKLYNLMFDVDNTVALVDNLDASKEMISLFSNLKKQGFNIILISNNHEERVKSVAQKLDVKYLCDADKPEKKAYDKALSILNSLKENTVAIGDQMLSDIAGAKKQGIYSILTDQLDTSNNIETGTAKRLQNLMIAKLDKKRLFSLKEYY